MPRTVVTVGAFRPCACHEKINNAVLIWQAGDFVAVWSGPRA